MTVDAASATDLLEKGIYAEETKGDLKGAAQIYRQLAEDPQTGRSLVAQAQLRLALCQLKMGNKPQATSALERLTQEFPDKDKLLALLGSQLPQLLDEMVTQIEQNYIQEVDRSELLNTAIRAIVGKLDPGFLRSNDLEFLSAGEMAEINASLQQEVAGVGIALKAGEPSQEVVVTSLLPHSPAYRSGLAPGDRIVAIDGQELPENETLPAAVRLIRGAPGTQVHLRVRRSDEPDALEFQLVREVVRLPSIRGDRYSPDHSWEFMLDDQRKIGYVRLLQIARQTPEELQAALTELQRRGMKGFILDLRNNPGGLLEQAVAVSDLFLDKGRILTVKGRAGEQVFDAHTEGTVPAFPMAVLVNRKTASAAEVIAASLQDHRRAVVIGERTFGQGIVRTLVALKDGVGSLKIPVASYFRPSGKPMNRFPGATELDEWGVTPDAGYEIVLTEDELKEYELARTARDVLSHAETPQPHYIDRPLQKATSYIQDRLGHP